MIGNDTICPYGLENKKDLEAAKDRFSLMLENLDEKMDDLNKTVKENFQEVNDRIDKIDSRLDAVHTAVEKRVDRMREDLPNLIDERIELADKNKVWNVAKWVVVSLLGSTVITMFSRYVALKLGL